MTAETKRTALDWLDALCAGEVETVLALMSDDFRYFLPGTMPTSGWWDRDGFFEVAQMLPPALAGPLVMEFGEITCEDDRVLVEAQSRAPLAAGGTYAGTYVFSIRVRDGKVVELKEFCDTLSVYNAVDAPRTRGASKPAESPFSLARGA